MGYVRGITDIGTDQLNRSKSSFLVLNKPYQGGLEAGDKMFLGVGEAFGVVSGGLFMNANNPANSTLYAGAILDPITLQLGFPRVELLALTNTGTRDFSIKSADNFGYFSSYNPTTGKGYIDITTHGVGMPGYGLTFDSDFGFTIITATPPDNANAYFKLVANNFLGIEVPGGAITYRAVYDSASGITRNEFRKVLNLLYANDPGAGNRAQGDLWYDTTDNTLKYFDGTDVKTIRAV